MPNSKISKNGELLRIVSDWFDKQAKKSIKRFSDTKLNRARKIVDKETETATDSVKYHLEQLFNTGKLSIAGIFKYMTQMVNVGLVDNRILRKMEKVYSELKRNDIKFIQWVKSHPSVSSYLSYYVIVAALSIASFGTIKDKDSNDRNDETTQNKEIIMEPVQDEVPENTYAYQNTDKLYNASSQSFIKNFVEDNWDDIVTCILEFETYLDSAKLQGSEPRCTYGPGLTWYYEKLPNNKIIQHKCLEKWAIKASHLSKEQIWEQVKLHIQFDGEVMSIIQAALKTNKIYAVSKQEVLALFVAGYQLPGNINGIVANLAKARNTQQEIDAFNYYKGTSKYERGTMKRRWWCAALYTGTIDVEDLRSLPRDVFSAAKLSVLKKGSHFQMNEKVVKYCFSLKNDNNTVDEFIAENNVLPDDDQTQMLASNQQSIEQKSDKFASAQAKLNKKLAPGVSLSKSKTI